MTLCAALAVGCTDVSTGDPRPADPVVASSGNTTTSAPPTRPRELRLDDIDPCALLPQADYADLELDKPGEPGSDDQGARECLWLGDIGYLSALLVTYEGVEAQEGRYGSIALTSPIEGFPTYSGTLPDDDNRCFVFVDVADGQHLEVQVALDSAPVDRPVCEFAHDLTSSIMSTLVSR